MKKIAAVLTGLLLAGAAATAQVPEILTLEGAVAQALEANRSLHAAALQLERSEQQLAATRTNRWPIFKVEVNASRLLTPLDFRIEAGQFGTYDATGPIPDRETLITTPQEPTAYVTGTVAQPLTQLYRIGLGVRIAELGRDIDRERVRAERISVLSEVKRVYRSLVQTNAGLEAARESVRVYREMDRTVDQYVALRTSLAGEGLEVKARLASQELKALTLEHALETQKEQMNELLGRDLTTDFSVTSLPEPETFELDLEAGRARALQRRSEVRQARLRAELAEYDRRSKKAEYIPEVSLAFSYYSFFNMQFLPRNVAALGLKLTWEPFDWGRKSRAKGYLGEAEAGLRKAKLDFARAQTLWDARSLTRPDYDAARASLEAAEARAESARAGLGSANIAFQDSSLVAPMNAVVLSREVERGTLVSPGTPGFVLADVSRVKVTFGVPDLTVGRLRIGQSLPVRLEALGPAEFIGRVTAISPAADLQSRVFGVEVTVPNSDGPLRPGMIATVRIPEDSAPAGVAEGLPLVPLSAIVKAAGTEGYAVFVVQHHSERATARLRPVMLGEVVGNLIGVSQGLQLGEKVVVSGATLLVDGETVRVIP